MTEAEAKKKRIAGYLDAPPSAPGVKPKLKRKAGAGRPKGAKNRTPEEKVADAAAAKIKGAPRAKAVADAKAKREAIAANSPPVRKARKAKAYREALEAEGLGPVALALLNAPDVPEAPQGGIQKKYSRPDMVGNSLWRLRRAHLGPKRIYDTPDELWEDAQKYFAWMDANPMVEMKVTQFGGEPVEMYIPKMRAMSITSLCMHLGMNPATWGDYAKRPEYKDICQQVEAVIYSQKLEGASADLLNPVIIVRELGLKDRTDFTSGDESITAITRTIIDDADKRKG